MRLKKLVNITSIKKKSYLSSKSAISCVTAVLWKINNTSVLKGRWENCLMDKILSDSSVRQEVLISLHTHTQPLLFPKFSSSPLSTMFPTSWTPSKMYPEVPAPMRNLVLYKSVNFLCCFSSRRMKTKLRKGTNTSIWFFIILRTTTFSQNYFFQVRKWQWALRRNSSIIAHCLEF